MERSNPQNEPRVLVTEAVELPRASVQGLCDAIRGAFLADTVNRPTRLQYIRGEGLLVERSMPASKVSKDSPFATPYQAVRQYAELEVLEPTSSIDAVCRAAETLRRNRMDASYLIGKSRGLMDQWFMHGRLDVLLRVPFAADDDCPSDILFICGSTQGPMLGQIEYAVACRME